MQILRGPYSRKMDSRLSLRKPSGKPLAKFVGNSTTYWNKWLLMAFSFRPPYYHSSDYVDINVHFTPDQGTAGVNRRTRHRYVRLWRFQFYKKYSRLDMIFSWQPHRLIIKIPLCKKMHKVSNSLRIDIAWGISTKKNKKTRFEFEKTWTEKPYLGEGGVNTKES